MSTRAPLSMIYLDPQKIGVAASDAIVAQLAGGAAPKGDALIEMGTWLEQGTTGPAPGESRKRRK